jgi:hypothetical protein
MGGLKPSGLMSRRPPRQGRNRARDQYRLQRRQSLADRRSRADGHLRRSTAEFRLLLSGNVGRTARHNIIAEQTGSHPQDPAA